jgi:hypothetical protein
MGARRCTSINGMSWSSHPASKRPRLLEESLAWHTRNLRTSTMRM